MDSIEQGRATQTTSPSRAKWSEADTPVHSVGAARYLTSGVAHASRGIAQTGLSDGEHNLK